MDKMECSACGKILPLERFPNKGATIKKCKPCHSSYMAWYRSKDPNKPDRYDPSYVAPKIYKRKAHAKPAPVSNASTYNTPLQSPFQSPLQSPRFALSTQPPGYGSNSNSEVHQLKLEVSSLKSEIETLKIHNNRLCEAINDIFERLDANPVPSVHSGKSSELNPHIELEDISWNQTTEEEDITPDFNYDLIMSVATDIEQLKDRVNTLDTRSRTVPEQIKECSVALKTNIMNEINIRFGEEITSARDSVRADVEALAKPYYSNVDDKFKTLNDEIDSVRNSVRADVEALTKPYNEKIDEKIKRQKELYGILREAVESTRDEVKSIRTITKKNNDIALAIEKLGKYVDNIYWFVSNLPNMEDIKTILPTNIPIATGVPNNPIQYKAVTYKEKRTPNK